MSETLIKNSALKTPSIPEKNCLWIAVYDRRGLPHDHGTQHHWAYVIGTKGEVLEREGLRFNVWKSHRLNLMPENKLEHENKIFEPENVRSTYGGCHINNPFSLFQLAEIKDERALRLHLMAHAIADAESARSWTCYDWVEAIFYDLLTDKSILICLSKSVDQQIGDFKKVMAVCTIPGIHCHDSAWIAPKIKDITDHGIVPNIHADTTQEKTEVAN